MLTVVSPAKRLNEAAQADFDLTEPLYGEEAKQLASVARGLAPAEISKLMHISDALADLNYKRYRDFGTMPRGAAALVFDGDTYSGLEAKSLDPDEMTWAADHLRILSGMYGLLRPTDAIEPHRLEMGSRLKTSRGKTLYEFWGSRISDALNAQAMEIGADVLVNCASDEYFRAVDRDGLRLRVITPVFKETRQGQPRIVSFFAKKARGAMARFIIQNRLTDPESLKDFEAGGYVYRPDMSEADKLVFLRDEES